MLKDKEDREIVGHNHPSSQVQKNLDQRIAGGVSDATSIRVLVELLKYLRQHQEDQVKHNSDEAEDHQQHKLPKYLRYHIHLPWIYPSRRSGSTS